METMKNINMKSFFCMMSVIVLAFAFSSCNDKEYVYIHDSGSDTVYVDKLTPITLNMPDCEGRESGSATRGIIYETLPNKIISYWHDSISIGIFPVYPTENLQARYSFNVPTLQYDFTTTFTGAGWGLRPDNTYAAYFPFMSIADLSYKAIPIDMTGQKQVGNKDMSHLMSYEILYSKADLPKDSTLVLNFKRINGIIWLRLLINETANWKRVSLTNTNGDSVFVTKATINSATGDTTVLERSSSIKLVLDNISSVANANDTIELFMSAMPIKSTGPMTLCIESEGRENRQLYYQLDDDYVAKGEYTRFTRTPTVSNHTAVDMGLDSKTMWSACNLGATLDFEVGDYYAWGDTRLPSEYYYWDTYSLTNSIGGNSMSTLSKYTIEDEYFAGSWYDDTHTFQGDNKKELEPVDDVAQFRWGGNWHVPTAAQFQELIDNCDVVWVRNYKNSGTNGYMFTSKKNSNQIFFPAAGWIGCERQADIPNFKSHYDIPSTEWPYREIDEDTYRISWKNASEINEAGYYWTSTLGEYSFDAVECKFTPIDAREDSLFHAPPQLTSAKRYLGTSIRPVMW